MGPRQQVWVSWSSSFPLIGGHCWHFANAECFFFRYTNDEQINHSNHRLQRRKWTREGNKRALYCYFRSNPTEREYRKRMIEIWVEFARFKTKNPRLADQVRTIIKKCWFSDLEILEFHRQIYRETYQQSPNTVTATPNTETLGTSN